ncbi:MAG: bifunctional oligoribonuclease/PAP phosphatase NrnA [Thermodesulfobacteriota bacterium]|nr:MAG: bifunctional oligoribonuclease/PAP phosphatase NrnA [Thermodesulfobacteriota bacterium]
MDKRFDSVVEKIKAGKRFMVVSHVNPEGDAIGSLLGLTLTLRNMGKEAIPYLEDPVPEIYKFLPGADDIVHDLKGKGPFDCIFAVDCGKLDRLGRGVASMGNPECLINIDHHTTNDRFGEINIIDAKASATGEMIYDFCKAAGVEITPEVAINLYVAIHTDTGSFRYSSTTPESLIKAGELLRLGADPWEVAMRVYENYPPQKFKLLSKVLATLDIIHPEGAGPESGIATLVVKLDMFKSTEADEDLSDGFVNYARGIAGVEVGALFRECCPGKYKVSLRSKKIVDVSKVANAFGGGGHAHAAGLTLKGSLEEIRAKVIGEIEKEIREAQKR